DECNSGSIVYATHNRSAATRWQICDDCRLKGVARSVAAVPDIGPLIGGDNPADYRIAPVVIRGNQISRAVVQFQGRISQCIGNIKWRCTKLGTYGANNYPLWF